MDLGRRGRRDGEEVGKKGWDEVEKRNGRRWERRDGEEVEKKGWGGGEEGMGMRWKRRDGEEVEKKGWGGGVGRYNKQKYKYYTPQLAIGKEPWSN